MMRKILGILLAVVLLGGIPAGGAAGPAASGTIRVAMVSDAALNPFTFPQQIATQFVASTVFSKIARVRPGDMTPVGDLATSWVPADNGRTWVFKFRRGVKWHDGTPFTANDIKFTLENIVNPNVRALYRSALRGLRRVDVLDDYTARIEFDSPVPSLPVLLSWWIVPMAPKHLLDGKDLNDLSAFAQAPVGSGPFKYKEAVKGSHVLVEANPDYYMGAPKLKSVVYKVLPEINTVMAQLRAGELDLAQVEAIHRDALQNVPHLGFRITEQPSVFFIALNNARWPFNDKKVRQAMMHGLNREAIISQIYRGTAPIASSPYPRAYGAYFDASIKPYAFDVNRAKQLLTEAGFRPGSDGVLQKDGRPLAFELMVDRGNPVREQIALFAQQSWRQIGANVRVTAEEWSVFVRRGNLQPGDYDARTGWRITALDPDKTPEYTTGGANNHFMYSNPEVDRLMAQGRAIFDRQQRIPIYHRVQKLIYDDVPLIWINYRTEILAMNKRVRDYPNLMLEDALFWMHLPRIAD
jgi:peptide/nickel transport system substrate-binding protein